MLHSANNSSRNWNAKSKIRTDFSGQIFEELLGSTLQVCQYILRYVLEPNFLHNWYNRPCLKSVYYLPLNKEQRRILNKESNNKNTTGRTRCIEFGMPVQLHAVSSLELVW